MSDTASTSLPRIGDTAPDWTQQTTDGEITFSEWQGGTWVILFSHPADFTPVCTTELTEFARRAPEFTELNTKLIGVSIDSIHAHLAWIQNMKDKLGVTLPYPLVADPDMRVAQLYGMIHPQEHSTATVRALFVIDRTRKIRALIYYPLNSGRNVDEVMRLLTALQTADEHGVACPVNWTPGDKVIVPPPKTLTEVNERLESGLELIDFYLAKKSL